MRYGVVDGVLLESVGPLWAAFSPVSGETTLLNDESAAILEVVRGGPADTWSVCCDLASDAGLSAEALVPAVSAHWAQLLDAGLLRPLLPAAELNA